MSMILTFALHPVKEKWMKSLEELKDMLTELETLIKQIPVLLRKTLGHPLIEQVETDDDDSSPKWKPEPSNDLNTVDFRQSKFSQFSLKYISKFLHDAINEGEFEQMRLNGG